MSSLLHVVDGLVEHVERPVRRRERREDGAAQLQAARADLERALQNLHSVVVLALLVCLHLIRDGTSHDSLNQELKIYSKSAF